MNRRSEIQLHMQQAVEGLSIAAITYYAVSLIGYLVKALEYIVPLHMNSDIIKAVAIPVVAGLVYVSVRRIRHDIRSTE
jgi:uncharacterized membrane-anchored protein